MKRIHKFAAMGICSLMATFALAPAALAAGTASGAAAGRTLTLPNSNIKGSPAHFSPSSLSAKARWTNGTPCTQSSGSFTMTNKKSKSEKVTFTGKNFQTFTVTVGAGKVDGICITKGYHGTLHGTLNDGKKLSVSF
jgi:hypothetical protein